MLRLTFLLVLVTWSAAAALTPPHFWGAIHGPPGRVARPEATSSPPACRLVPPPKATPSGLFTTLPYRVPVPQPSLSPGQNLLIAMPHDVQNAKVVIFVHGGGLKDFPDQATLEEVATEFARAWHVETVLPEYTLDPKAVATTPRESVYAALDVGCAVAWVERYIAHYNGSPSGLVLAGYSAGAAVASTVAVDPTYIQAAGGDPGGVAAVVPMSGRYDYRYVPYALGETTQDWKAMHADDSAPYTLAQSTPYRWLLTYEQCDADEQYGNFARFTARLRAFGNSVVAYENQVGGAHGQGELDLEHPGSPFAQEFSHFVRNDGRAQSTSGNERIPLNAYMPSASRYFVGVDDVGVGGDGSAWIVEDAQHGNRIAKYSNPNDWPHDVESQRGGYCLFEDPLHTSALRIAADGVGSPWVVRKDGRVAVLPGGLAGTRWVGAPLPGSVHAVDVGAGGTYDAPQAWVAATDGNLYRYDYPSRAFVREAGPPGVTAARVAVADTGEVWLAGADHTYYMRTVMGSWSAAQPGDAIDVGAGPAAFVLGTSRHAYAVSDGNRQPLIGAPLGDEIAGGALSLPFIAHDPYLYLVH